MTLQGTPLRFGSDAGAGRFRPRQGRSGKAENGALIDVARTERRGDSVFAFALFVPLLFVTQLGTLGAAVFIMLGLIYAATNATQLHKILVPRAFLLAVPLFALFSILWSEAPEETLKYALEFIVTVAVGLLLSAAPQPKAVLWGLFWAFALYVASALVFGQIVNIGVDNGGTAFSGLTDSKNLLADIASTGLLVSVAILFAGIEDRRLFRSLAALLVAPLQFYALYEARSAGSLLGFALGFVTLFCLLGLRSAGSVLRGAATAILSVCLVAAAFTYREFSASVIAGVTQFFDKDSTFTGRTYLWQRAADLIAEKPILGKGFHAFWLQGNPDAEGLWRYAGIDSREGFSFHNTLIEILVHLGWAGAIICGVTLLVATAFLVRRFMTRPTLSLCFWLSLVVYEIVRMPIEVVGISQLYFSTVLLFIAFGSAFALRRTTPEAFDVDRDLRPSQSPRPVLAASRMTSPNPAQSRWRARLQKRAKF
jgi:exopolysaccharide production protein ExoQ